MTVTIEHKSVVVLGGFNPTILTPGFLRNCCDFTSDHKPEGQITPVASELRFGNSHFLMELNRFQVSVRDINTFERVFPLDIAKKYLDILEYTPLQVFGINLSFFLSEIQLSPLRKLLKDPWSIGENLGIEPVNVSLNTRKPDGGGLELHEVVINHMVDADIKNNIRFTFQPPKLTINNNFEVGRLDQDRNRLSILIDHHKDILSVNQSLIDKMEKVGR